MQSLFVLLRITIFRKTFISPLANENFVFSKQIPHVTIKMKIHRISRHITDDKIPHMPQNKINTPAGQTGRFPYPARLNRKFRHPASPAKGFRILPRPSRFPYSAPAQNFRIAKKHLHPLRMEVFRLFKLPITQQQKYLLQLCIRPCVPTGCVFP